MRHEAREGCCDPEERLSRGERLLRCLRQGECETEHDSCSNSVELDVKHSPFTQLGFRPNSSARALDNALANCEPDSSAGIGVVVQPFEQPKNPLCVFGVKTDAVIAN